MLLDGAVTLGAGIVLVYIDRYCGRGTAVLATLLSFARITCADWLDPIGVPLDLYGDFSAECELNCRAGYGCGYQDGSRDPLCIQCPRNSASTANSSNCYSCSFDVDTFTGTLKRLLMSTDDRSHCTVRYTAVSAFNGSIFLSWAIFALLLSAIAIHMIRILYFKETRLHMALRCKAWKLAERMFDEITDEGYGVARDAITAEGFDGKTPLQIILGAGAASSSARRSSSSATNPDRARLAASMIQPAVVCAPTIEKWWCCASCHGRMGTSPCCKEMLSTTGLFFLVPIIGLLSGVYCGAWAGSLIGSGIDIYFAEQGGATPLPRSAYFSPVSITYWLFPYMPNTSPPRDWLTKQEETMCGSYCVVWSIIFALGLGFMGVVAGFISVYKAGDMMREMVANASGAHDLTISLTWLIVGVSTVAAMILTTVLGKSTSPLFAGIVTAIIARIISFVGATVLGDQLGRCCTRFEDPLEMVLTQVLTSERKMCSLKTTPKSVDIVYPVVVACLRSIGSVAWAKVLPPGASETKISRAVEIALRIAHDTSKKPLRDGSNVLHTLIEAHAASIVDTIGVIRCVRAVASCGAPSLARFSRNKTGRTVADLAMATAKSREIKETLLVVLYGHYAVTSLATCIYESATCRVYRAEDLETGRIIALKLFSDSVHFDKEMVIRTALDAEEEMSSAVVKMIRSFNGAVMDSTTASPGMESALRTAFTLYDIDNSGDLDLEEVRILIGAFGRDASSAETVFTTFDADQSGAIEFDEFLKMMQVLDHDYNPVAARKNQIAVSKRMREQHIPAERRIELKQQMEKATRMQEISMARRGNPSREGIEIEMSLQTAEGGAAVPVPTFEHIHNTREVENLAILKKEFAGGAIVMPIAHYDLNARLSSTRIAGESGSASFFLPIFSWLYFIM